VVTHSHLDHVGWLPRLVRHGFAGPVYCSPWTAQVAPIVLRDAAHLQEEDARYASGHGYSRHSDPQPLFDRADAEKAIELLRPMPYHHDQVVAAELAVRLTPAGHILGSSIVQVHAGARSLGFSGDLGRADHPLLTGPGPAPAVDAMVVSPRTGIGTIRRATWSGSRLPSGVPSPAVASWSSRRSRSTGPRCC